MTRVYVVVEGPAEESFIKNTLAPVLWSNQVYLTPIIIGAPGHKGGNVTYARVKKDVLALLKQDSTSFCSMMVDFYGLGPGFPGTPAAVSAPNIAKVTSIEQAVKADIVATIPDRYPNARFLPYLQLHEFEALLFSNPNDFASSIGKPQLRNQFQAIRAQFPTPEDINDDPNTAPSKRVIGAHPGYRKVVEGTLAANAIGISRMRAECPHFDQWVQALESL
jgi:hypothetical protein